MFVSSKCAAILASVALAATGGAASAQEFLSNGRTAEVRHGDLDLTKAADQRQLRSRIARAASRVCASTDLSTQMACRAQAIAHVEAPISAAIARAETQERYADASTSQEVRPVVGN
ncbi:UrcA family protein [Sphingobium sp. HBC34]|uniref:UrcA family protein n=1 Tax=Sphingobium cyanobacteriorum TaxID=3063954 RepID=A0ABT8ZL51_9SPHN|nr:UrcA family protein [Sphingobium sp. HBC34]MDO7834266.1 UrcA family protein [Sphingobium sp. HBC34]